MNRIKLLKRMLMKKLKLATFLLLSLFTMNTYALENGDMINVSLVKNLNSELDVNGVKYASVSNYSETYEFDYGGAGLGLSIEYLKRIKQLDGKKLVKGFEHAYYVSAGIEYHFTREADKGTYSFSDGSSGAIEANILKAAEITPLNIYVGFNMLVNNLIMFHVGLAHSTLGYEATYTNSSGDTSNTESESTMSFQIGFGAVYDNFTAKMIFRSTSFDIDGTATISGSGTTVEGEADYSQTMLSFGYMF